MLTVLPHAPRQLSSWLIFDVGQEYHMHLGLRICLAAAYIAAVIWGSVVFDRKWRAAHPGEQPFRWGYFQALIFFPGSLVVLAVPFFYPQLEWYHWFIVVVQGIGGSLAGYTLLKRKKRWAWLFVVLAQLNLVNFIINYHYGKNRWNEFR